MYCSIALVYTCLSGLHVTTSSSFGASPRYQQPCAQLPVNRSSWLQLRCTLSFEFQSVLQPSIIALGAADGTENTNRLDQNPFQVLADCACAACTGGHIALESSCRPALKQARERNLPSLRLFPCEVSTGVSGRHL